MTLHETQKIECYKSLHDLKKQYGKYNEDNKYKTTDVMVGKAMDFMYSNKTIMSLIARELWNIGSRAIDRIVDFGNEKYLK